MLVIDASATVDLLLARRGADEIERHLVAHGFDLHAPHLLDLEVASALRRLVSAGDATSARAGEAIDDLLELPLERHPHAPLLPRVWQLRETVTAYDAAYLALAEALSEPGIPVLTSDGRFARSIAAVGTVEALLIA